MKQVITIILCGCIFTSMWAQKGTPAELIEKTCLSYIEGFYEGDAEKLKTALSPVLHKFGYWQNKGGEYGESIYMTYEGALEFAQEVKEKENFAKDDAPKNVEILDVMEQIAAVKITAWWGYDYILLSKVGDAWMIQEVLWQGPLKK